MDSKMDRKRGLTGMIGKMSDRMIREKTLKALGMRTSSKRFKISLILAAVLLISSLSACATTPGSSSSKANDKLKEVTVVLDWTPNTNHTGLYVAVEKGFYQEEGLHVSIIRPGQGGSDKMVAAGSAHFGVGNQESITFARMEGVPIVSIAAIIQHNTSGFASPAAKNIKSPKHFEGKNYGGWGSPIENATIASIMKQDGGDFSKVNMMNIGEADYFTAVKRDIDFSWIFYAWTGIEAELRKEPTNMIYLKDFSEKLDYYTPVLVTSEKLIAEEPALITAFMSATSRGYQFAIDQPEEAAQVLIQAEPDLDKDLVIASQKWLSPHYQDDAAQWGLQKKEVWVNYADWLKENKLFDLPFDSDKAFTNQFLPTK